MNSDCIFCNIVAGKSPSTRIMETDTVLAFLDIGPIIKGHTLVIPKAHHDPLTALPVPLLGDVIQVVQQIARAQRVALNAEGINITQANGACAGQEVPHVHFHVIPRFNDDGHHWNWNATSYTDDAERETMGDCIRNAVSVATPSP